MASFTATHIAPRGGNQFDVTGTFSLKGHEQQVTVPTTLVPDGNAAVLEGHLAINRLDFAIGEGPWTAVDVLANPVDIAFHLTVTGQ